MWVYNITMRTTYTFPAGKPLPWITPKLLRDIAPAVTTQKAVVFAEAFARLCPQFGMDTPTEFEEFIANVMNETGSLTAFTENLNYGAQGLANTWPTRYALNPKATVKKPNDLALKLARKPEAIANNAYANRMGNGNEGSGDGWRYRGGGGLQSTGKAMYAIGANYFDVPVAEYARLIQTEPEWIVLSALHVFCVNMALLDEAVRDESKKIRQRLNGGLIGFEEVERFRVRAKAALKC